MFFFLNDSGPCGWERRSKWPSFLYSKSKTWTNWNTRNNVGEADYFVIFVKYLDKTKEKPVPTDYDVFKDGKKWQVAFRGTSGIEKSVYQALVQKQNHNVESACKRVSVCLINSIYQIIYGGKKLVNSFIAMVFYDFWLHPK